MSGKRTTPRDSFDTCDDGIITRRQLLHSLGAAAVAIPALSFGQAPAGGNAAAARGQGGAARDTIPLTPPFAPTGWKTVWLDHLSYQCADYEKAAAFYVALMGWKVRSDDGTQAVLEIGENSGDIIMRGGLAAPPSAALTDASVGAVRAKALFDGFAWGIEPWNTDVVKAELEKRGLHPVADHSGSDYKAFRFKDPDGFDVWVTNGTKARRRKKAAAGKLRAAAPFKPTNWKTLFVDHLSFEVADYRRSAAFYQALLGWQVRGARGTAPSWPDAPNSMTMIMGDVAGAIVRTSAAGRGAGSGRGSLSGDSSGRLASPSPATATATIGHISFGIGNWNAERVRAELIERDVVYAINGTRTPRDDMAGGLESFHVPDAMGWDLQISNRIAP